MIQVILTTLLLCLFGPLAVSSQEFYPSPGTPNSLLSFSWRNTFPMDFTAVTWADDRFVAVGNDSAVLVSTNGIDWYSETTRFLGGGGTTSFRYARGVYVANIRFGGSMEIWATTNLASAWVPWSFPTYFGDAGIGATSLLERSGIYFSTLQGRLWRSTNGLNWTGAIGLTSDLATDGQQMIGLFLKHGLRRSQDGVTWTVEAFPNPLWDQVVTINYLGGRWLAQGADGTIISSKDGVTWTYTQLQPPGAPDVSARPVFLRGAWFVRSGTNYFRSEDLLAWDLLPTQPPPQIRQYASNGDLAVGVGTGGALYYTTNFLDWTLTLPGRSLPFTAVRHAGDVTLALTASAPYLRSTNGAHWFPGSLPLNVAMKGLAHGADRYVLVGENGTVLVSTNAWDWQTASSGTQTHLNQVVYEAGKFVAVGGAGTVITSDDGEGWEPLAVDPPVDLVGLGFLRGEFLAVGVERSLFRSTDLHSWRVEKLPGTNQPNAIAIDPERGQVVIGSANAVLMSAGGGGWKESLASALESPETVYGNGVFLRVSAKDSVTYSVRGGYFYPLRASFAPANSLCFGHGTFIMVGPNGLIVQSALALQILADAGNPGVLQLYGRVGDRYRVESSASGPGAFSWEPESDVLMTENPQSFTLSPAPAPGARYFRAVSDSTR